jgi:Protein of unknown function (DUF3025)
MLAKTSHPSGSEVADLPGESSAKPLARGELLDADCYDNIRAAATLLDFSGEKVPDIDALNQLLMKSPQPITNANGHRLSFTAHNIDPSALGYEAQIFSSGAVPTRADNVHDLFNALVWVSFPLSKAAINARHIASRHDRAERKNRGPVQDALTLFDESGVIVVSDRPQLLALIEDFSWKELFWRQREAVVRHMRFFLFGHGLMEQMLAPYIGVTGKALLMNVESAWLEGNTDALLQHIDAKSRDMIASPTYFVRGRDLFPLPLLGIPGWSQENERESFYDNVDYFRRGRREES